MTTMSDPSPLVSVSVDDGVLTLVLARERRLNALIPELHTAIQHALQEAVAEPTVRAVVLTGAGRAFCAGGDVRAMAERPRREDLDVIARERARAAERHRLEHAHDTVRRIASLPLPVVAAINGPAAGAGLSLALAADVRVAAESAILSVAFPQMGLSGDSGISVLLPEVIGRARARVALLRGARWTATEAREMGLIHEVVPESEVVERAVRWARELSTGSPKAVELIRSKLLAPMGLDEAMEREAEAMLDCQETADHHEAVAAFLSKRQPRFEGR